MGPSVPKEVNGIFPTSLRQAALVCFALSFCIASVQTTAMGTERSEAMIRAAIIFGILRFTYWPEENQPQNVLNLCEVGVSKTASAIRNSKIPPTIGNTSVTLLSTAEGFDSGICHALLIGRDAPTLAPIHTPIITFCDDCSTNDYENTAIRLRLKNNQVQFEVNLDQLNKREITLSASVIELASKCYSSNPSIRGCNDN